MRYEPVPTYNVTTRLNDRHIAFETPIPDPFARTEVTVGRRDILRAAWRAITRREELRVTVLIGGNRDALLHVMNPRSIEVADSDGPASPGVSP